MEKINLFKQMELDSALLKRHNLIDYSVFLIQVDLQQAEDIRAKVGKKLTQLVFNA